MTLNRKNYMEWVKPFLAKIIFTIHLLQKSARLTPTYINHTVHPRTCFPGIPSILETLPLSGLSNRC
jgi:hypothetical protein